MMQLVRWSYSTWAGMKACPRKVRYEKIDKLEGPDNKWMVRGEKIHRKAEHYVKGGVKVIPPEFKKLAKEIRDLKKQKPEHVEQFWGFTREWKPLRKGFHQSQTFTIKADVAMAPRKGTAVVIDYKTGKIYDGHDDQAELSAIAARLWYPVAKKIEVEFWYVDSGQIFSYDFLPKYLDRRLRYWDNQGAKILAERKFLPTPSNEACKWCPYRSDKGGPCTAHKVLDK